MIVRSLCLTALLSVACAQNVVIPSKSARAALESAYVGRVVELRVSSYFGDLFEENELWLLSPGPVTDLQVLQDLDGTPIRSHDQRGIVPAGTRFVVEAIEFPHPLTFPKRLLTSPRYNPWVILRLVDDVAVPENRAFVALLPMGLTSQSAGETALAQWFGADGEVRAWLASLSPTERAAIRHKATLPDMSREARIAALGDFSVP